MNSFFLLLYITDYSNQLSILWVTNELFESNFKFLKYNFRKEYFGLELSEKAREGYLTFLFIRTFCG